MHDDDLEPRLQRLLDARSAAVHSDLHGDQLRARALRSPHRVAPALAAAATVVLIAGGTAAIILGRQHEDAPHPVRPGNHVSSRPADPEVGHASSPRTPTPSVPAPSVSAPSPNLSPTSRSVGIPSPAVVSSGPPSSARSATGR